MDEVKVFGLLGEKLSHSYSKIIHEAIEGKYELLEVSKENFDTFMKEKNFDAINVTIPYKEMVIPYLDFVDEKANKIGAVNTIVKKDGKLYGYNTDYDGFKYIILKNNFEIKNSNCLILGTGGTSKTVYTVLKDLKAKKIDKASRNGKDGALKYEEINYPDYDYIINTTPVGMYPNIFSTILEKVNVKGIIDVIYNPFRTKLLSSNKNIKYSNGLDMLIYQAIKSHEYFIDKPINEDKLLEIRRKLKKSFLNIVLIGMPGCGKTTISKKLSEELDMIYIDTDSLIEAKTRMKIDEIFSKYGEKKFREIEKEVIKDISIIQECIISTGGGVILNKDNVDALMANGIIFYINRSIDNIYQDLKDRPLAKSREDLVNLFEKRSELYNESSDYIVDNNEDLSKTIKKIKELIEEFYNK